MEVQIKEAAAFLQASDRILILSHQNPDGDTIGSAFALYYSLKQMGKQVRIDCHDGIPARFCLFSMPEFDSFEPQTVVAVDIADTRLFGEKLQKYTECVDLCIDHHPTNKHYAGRLLLEAHSAATCEVIYSLLQELSTKIDPVIASYLYMGISTDTGCFKFSNTTARTHQFAAELMRLGADYVSINTRFFDTKSKGRIMLERSALESMRFYFQEKCSLIVISRKMIEEFQTDESELDGVAAIPRQIEGVQIGITIREREDGSYKVSMRSGESIDVSGICGLLGGGGHKRAAGCVLTGNLEQVIDTILNAVAEYTKWDKELI